ncbi:MAG: sigma-70 family RNA polymerase sigma factor [Caldilineaceae bacterium]|nr:sigma-70 family RNA polymerase sigma factor [Caldilineaceae bacterium]
MIASPAAESILVRQPCPARGVASAGDLWGFLSEKLSADAEPEKAASADRPVDLPTDLNPTHHLCKSRISEGMRRLQSGSSVDEQTIVDLIERAQRYSDPEAFAGLYELFTQLIFQYLCARFGSVESAEEITSQVFLRLIEKITLYRIAPDNNVSNFTAWLKRVATNLMVDMLRARKRARFTALEHAEDVPADFSSSTIDEGIAFEEILQELKSLNDLQHDVIVLRFLEDLTIAETAQIMQKTEGAVKALQHRALESLRRQLTRRDRHDLRKYPRSLYRSA